jgi:curved DNA-binding protein
VELKIPSNSKSGNKMRLKGRGIPGKPAGDLYAVLQVVLPPADSEQAKALYREMEQKLAFNPRAGLGV